MIGFESPLVDTVEHVDLGHVRSIEYDCGNKSSA
jgi:hypothetical protein